MKYKEIAKELQGEVNDKLTLEFANGNKNGIRVGYIPNLQPQKIVQQFIDWVEYNYDLQVVNWYKDSVDIIFT